MDLSSDLIAAFGNYYFRFHALKNEYEFLHPRLLALLGYSLEQVNAVTIQKLIKKIDRSYETRDETGSDVISIREVNIACADGSTMWFAEYSKKVKDEKGRLIGNEGYFRRNDLITESSGEGRSISDSFNKILRELPDTAFICDNDSILAASPEFMRRLDLNPALLRNKISISDVFRPDIVKEMIQAFADVQPNIPVEIPDFIFGRSELEASVCVISSLKILKAPYYLLRFDFNPHIPAAVTPGEKVIAPPEQVPSQTFAPAAEPQNSAQALYKKKAGDLLTKISHDIKAELSVISSFTRMLELEQSTISREEQAKIIEGISGKCRSLLDLHQDLMDYSRLELGIFQVTTDIVSVGNMINEEIERLSTLFKAKGIILEYTSVPGVFLQASQILFARMLNHLIVNAIKFSPRGSKVSIVLTDNLQEVGLKITNLCSVPGPEVLKQFNSGVFSFSTKGTEAETGNGMGLKMVYALVRSLQGRVIFSGDEEKFIVEVFLPRTE